MLIVANSRYLNILNLAEKQQENTKTSISTERNQMWNLNC